MRGLDKFKRVGFSHPRRCKHINKGVALTTSKEGTPETSTIFRITQYENLEWAYEKTLKNGGRHATEAIQFKKYEVTNLLDLQKDMQQGTYQFGRYRRKIVYEPKERIVDVPEIRDKIAQHAIHNIIKEKYFSSFVFDTYACIDDKGTHKAVERLHHFIKKAAWEYGEETQIIKIDISKFFYSIDRELLKAELPRKIKCEQTLAILYEIIDSAGQISPKGIPLGNPLSHILANVAMNPLDQHAKRAMGLKYYLRYADDIFIVVKDLETARETLEEIMGFIVEELHLKCNEDKTKIFPVDQGVNALGFKIWKTHLLLRNRSKRNIKRKTKKMGPMIADGRMTSEKAEQILNSWNGHASNASSNNFIDRLIERHPWIYREGDKLKVDDEKARELYDLQVDGRRVQDLPF